jgi:hypothetical protein
MFYIQAPMPALRRPAEKTYASLGQAIRASVRRFTEEMFWVWAGVPISVGYAEPFGTLYRSTLGMLEACISKDRAAGTYSFHEAAIDTEWHVAWGDGVVHIDSTWFRAPGGLEIVLRERASIELPLADFIAEWKMPLRRVLDVLEGAGVTVAGADEETLARLRATEAAIPRAGWLYNEDEDG